MLLRRRLLAAAVLGALAVCSATTPRAASLPSEPLFTFALYGDCRDGNETHRRICASILAAAPRFVVHSGDLVRRGDQPELWGKFHRITAPLRAKIPFHASKGNHDTSPDGAFERELKLERAYRSVTEGPVEIFLLDSTALDAAQLEWLDAALTRSTARRKIAVFHHPCFSMMAKRQDSAARMRQKLHDRFVKARLCAVLAGHDHHFCTTERDGVRHVVSGGGGAPLYDQDRKLAGPQDRWAKIHHYVLVTVREHAMNGQVFAADGKPQPELDFPVCAHP
jgi:3',5'-cyclic AMP phosphodiesterase CpdA